MLEAPIPKDEDRRIHSLRSLSILDTQDEERFDRITRLATRIFDVPIALVSLVDVERQWFKSRQGVDARETPRAVSFCGHAILRDETMVVQDTLRDERFADNPLVTDEPNIRFYAGCPVRAPDGHALGTLCIIDQVPRELPEHDRQALEDLAGMVGAEIATLAQATTDELTGISNRRGFEMLGNHTLHVAARNKLPVALAFLDLDRFKEINDTLGHAAGDQALIELAGLLLEVFRDADVVARLGGDEFGVLMSAIPESEVHRPLERLAARIAQRNASPDARFDIHYSTGCVTDPMTAPRSVADLLAQADHFMYEQKKQRAPRTSP